MCAEAERADAVLMAYRFRRDPGPPLIYTRVSGVFVVRVMLATTGTATLSLGVTDAAGATRFRPWSMPARAHDPDVVAIEATWFIATLEDLTPPVRVGTVKG